MWTDRQVRVVGVIGALVGLALLGAALAIVLRPLLPHKMSGEELAERYEQIVEGMSLQEVKTLLGQSPRPHHVRVHYDPHGPLSTSAFEWSGASRRRAVRVIVVFDDKTHTVVTKWKATEDLK